MTDLITAGKLCKEEREKRGLSRKDIHNITKIPVDIIKRLEEDENYLRKDPYAYFLMKVLIDYYQLNIKLEKNHETDKRVESVRKVEDAEERQGFLVRLFKTVFVFLVGFIFFFISTSGKNKKESSITEFLHLISTPQPEDNWIEIKDGNSKNDIQKISLKANDYVWITAYIDGKEKVIKMKKGQKVKLFFKHKIKFETIGNAKNLVILFDNKKVDFEKKVVHNLYVDGDGVFYNGYNLAKEES
ncbi:helix-turn-helix domain-containing protein [Persephonella sp.]|uniref:helix-turn-helix domain-containing protein n=1 Tax=Persephonella sp. TaxID=2060922 RepID=UPI0025FBF6DF|nr:helix-turn-helix domain-containing protein [Persephonella sp.]